MKIAICGSMAFSKKMMDVEQELLKQGHDIVLPKFTKEYAKLDYIDHTHTESARNKVEHDLIRGYFNEIRQCDAVLIVNENKNSIASYIGGNSFLEMGFAHVLNKKIFLLNSIPEMIYTDEIQSMSSIVLNGDLSKIQ